MAREYKGTGKKAVRRYKYDSRPGFVDNGGLHPQPYSAEAFANRVGDGKKPRPTLWTEVNNPDDIKLSSERPEPEIKPVTPREIIEDYHQRGYWAPRKGETRVLEQVGQGDWERNQKKSSGGEAMLNQLNKAQRQKK